LKGLEVTVRPLSLVRREHLFLRIDSEHCQKVYLANVKRIRCWAPGWIELGKELKEITGGATPLGADYPETGIRFLRVQNVMPNYIDDADMVYISASNDRELARSRLQTDDVLLTITGVSYGKSATVTPEFAGSNINQHSVRMHLKQGAIRPFFLSTFLNAVPGKLQSDQNITGVTRPALDYTTIRHFSIPLCSDLFQAQIEAAVRAAHAQLQITKVQLTAAEKTLGTAMGIGDWHPAEPLTYTARASEALANSRLDAEYHNPARKSYLDRLRKMPGHQLGYHYAPIREMFDPASSPPGEMVRNFDLDDAMKPVLDDSKGPVPASTLGSSKKRFSAGDVVTSRLRAYLRETALVQTSNAVPTVGSSEFIVLRSLNRQEPLLTDAALLAFLRSRPVQTILHWSQDGSHHPRYGEEDLLTIPVPDAVCQASQEIGRCVQAVLASRERARLLLFAATRAVEVAIAQSERVALAYLKNQGIYP
jgi:type I restriction enzyme M protein